MMDSDMKVRVEFVGYTYVVGPYGRRYKRAVYRLVD